MASQPYAYIRRYYGVDAAVGQRITVNGKPGVIVRPQGDPQYLRVRFDGQKHIENAHPTWEVVYAPTTPAPAAAEGRQDG